MIRIMLSRRLRLSAPAIAVVLALVWPIGGMAQTVPTPPSVAEEASVGHAAMKDLTLKTTLAVASMALFYAGTGSLFASSMLATVVSGASYTVYVVNDYLWDRYSPDTNANTNNQSLSATTNVNKKTAKFLTFKPAVMAADWGAIYLYTGSLTSMVTMGPAFSLMLPVVFYLNNTAWDWYDWRAAPTVSNQVVADRREAGTGSRSE